MPAGSQQIQRAAETRRALVAAARRLFVEVGYFETGTPAIVAAADVTRGALYHHFADKKDLFRAVFEEVGTEIRDAQVESVTADFPEGSDQLTALRIGLGRFLEVVVNDVEMQRILLIDGPVVLGWAEWTESEGALSFDLIEAALTDAHSAGIMAAHPPRTMAHMILGLLNTGALLVANADDQAAALRDATAAIDALISGLRIGEPDAGRTAGR